jgi:hypothetical protein
MPALDFPSSPTNGQVYGQYTYDSTKSAWRVTANPTATVVSSPTAPSSPVAGNLWLNTNDGVLFVYYNDGDTSQWVEVKSNTASGSTVAARVDAIEAKPAGLVGIVPTSVVVSSGSATVSGSGLVTVTGAAGSVSLNGCFSSTYRFYRIMIEIAGTNNDVYMHMRLRAAGSDYSGTGYYSGGIQGWSNGTTNSWAAANTTMWYPGAVSAASNGPTQYALEIYNPYETTYTRATSLGIGSNSGQGLGTHSVGMAMFTATAYDGITFYMGSGNVSAGVKIKVYGYRE